MKNNKFKEGDIITGTKESRWEYEVTDDDALMRVNKIIDDKFIEVEVLKHESRPSSIGHKYSVESRFFKLSNYNNENLEKTNTEKSKIKNVIDILNELTDCLSKTREEIKDDIMKDSKRTVVTLTFDQFAEVSNKVMKEIDERFSPELTALDAAAVLSVLGNILYHTNWEE